MAGGLINENAIFTMPGEQGANLTLVSSTITDNRAVGGTGHLIGGSAFGGGLLNLAADLTDTGSTIVGNQVQDGTGHFRGFDLGGGFLSIGGSAALNGTTIQGNRASGGLANDVFTLLSQPGGPRSRPRASSRRPASPRPEATSCREQPRSTPPRRLISRWSRPRRPTRASVTVTYQIQDAGIAGPVPIAIYRSADDQFDPRTDIKLGEQTSRGRT